MKAEKDKKIGKWLIQYRYTDWQGKRRKSTKRGFATKREAEEWLRNFLITQKADFDMKFEDFWKMYRRGETVKEILEQTGISNRRLYIEIEKRKIPKREKRSGSRNSDFYEKTKNHSDYIIEHYNQGENWTQIARALCMDYNTVKSVIEDAKKKKLIDEKRDCDIDLEKERKQASIVASVYMKKEHKPDVKKLAELFKVDVNRLYYAIGKAKLEE